MPKYVIDYTNPENEIGKLELTIMKFPDDIKAEVQMDLGGIKQVYVPTDINTDLDDLGNTLCEFTVELSEYQREKLRGRAQADIVELYADMLGEGEEDTWTIVLQQFLSEFVKACGFDGVHYFYQ